MTNNGIIRMKCFNGGKIFRSVMTLINIVMWIYYGIIFTVNAWVLIPLYIWRPFITRFLTKIIIYLTKFLFNSMLHFSIVYIEAALLRCYSEKVFWKYTANLQEHTHAKVRNHTTAWVFSFRFAVYFQNTFS